MKTYLARYYNLGKAYAMSLQAESFSQARTRCARNGWRLEEDAAKRDP